MEELTMICRSSSDNLLPVAGLIPAGTVVKGCSLFQSRMAFKWMVIAVATLLSFTVSVNFNPVVHSAAFFSASALDLAIDSVLLLSDCAREKAGSNNNSAIANGRHFIIRLVLID